MLKTKLVKREVNLKSLRYGKVEPASGSRARQKITLQQGIPQETAKKLVAEIKAKEAQGPGAPSRETPSASPARTATTSRRSSPR